MNIYFFSYHAPDPKMIKDLGSPLTVQFKGEISNIHTQGNLISFTETLYLGGQRIKANHTIPTESIVIVEASPLLQEAWLTAGISTLLVPQMKREVNEKGCVVLKYCGLVQIHKIEVITSGWNCGSDNPEDKQQKTSEEKIEPTSSSDSFSMANLFQHLRRKPAKPVASC